jgi:hypothetical protein
VLRDGRKTAARSTFTPYSGQVVFGANSHRARDITRGKAIAAGVAEHLKREYSAAHFRLGPSVRDIQAYIWAGFAPGVRYTYLVDVSNEKRAWGRLDENHRRSIRKAHKLGLLVECSLSVEEFVSLFRGTRDAPAETGALLTSYEHTLKPKRNCQTLAIRNTDGEALSAIFMVWDHFRAYYLVGGYRERGEDGESARIATTFGLWEAMKFARDSLGLTVFDLEGSMIPGVELFFRKFGGELTPYYTIRWNADGDGGIIGRTRRMVSVLKGTN